MKGGNVYLTIEEKKMIEELIEMYYVASNVEEKDAEIIYKIRTKIEK